MRIKKKRKSIEMVEKYVETDFFILFENSGTTPDKFILSTNAYLTFYQGSNIGSGGIRYEYIGFDFNIGQRKEDSLRFKKYKSLRLGSIRKNTFANEGINRSLVISLFNKQQSSSRGIITNHDEWEEIIDETFDIYENRLSRNVNIFTDPLKEKKSKLIDFVIENKSFPTNTFN